MASDSFWQQERSYDPALLEDPEWQAALAAVEDSPLKSTPVWRRRPRQAEETSPLFLDHCARFDDADDEVIPQHVIDLTSPVHPTPISRINSQSRNASAMESARTQPRTPLRRNTPSPSPGRSPASNNSTPASATIVPSDDDESEDVEILGVPLRRSRSLSPSVTSTTGTNSASPISTEDLDRQCALQLQEELNRNAHGGFGSALWDDAADVTSYSPPSPSLPSYSRNFIRNTPREQAPSGPMRGAQGVRNTRDTNPRSPFLHSDVRPAPPTFQSTSNISRNNRLSPRELPPLSRSSSTPLSPAHAPPFNYFPTTPHHRQSLSSEVTIHSDPILERQQQRLGASFAPSSASFSRAPTYAVAEPSRYQPRTTLNASAAPLGARGSFERFLSGPSHTSHIIDVAEDGVEDNDDDTMRLRSGVDTTRTGRQQLRNIVRMPHQRLRAVPRAANNRRGNGGLYEVDTSNYEEMMRLIERVPPVARGASSRLIDSLAVVQGANEDCTICIGTAQTAMVALPCLHKFHKECILPHLKTSRLCPNCRHELE